MNDGKSAGKLGQVAKISGIGCLVGLVILLLGALGSSSWFLMHDQPVAFLVGAVCVYGALVWLLVIGILAWRSDEQWKRQEVMLVALVGLTFLATVLLLK